MKKEIKRDLIVILFFLGLAFFLIIPLLINPSITGFYAFNQVMEKSYFFDVPEMIKTEKGFIPNLDNTELVADPGNPYLPYRTVKLIVPYGKGVEKIETSGNKEFIGDYEIAYGDKFIPYSYLGREINITPQEKNSEIYSLENYPEKANPDFEIQKFRGYNLILFNLYPLQYNLKTKEIYYYPEIKIKIYLRDSLSLQSDESDNLRNLEKDSEKLKLMVDNPEQADLYPSYNKISTLSSESNFDSTEKYDYIIITSSEFADYNGENSFNELIDWKKQKGLKARIVKKEDILLDSAFDCRGEYGDGCDVEKYNDTQARIRNFIKFAYQNWEVEYVLLGGDADRKDVGGESGDNIIPVRLFYPRYKYYSGDNSPSDNYYSNLDGSLDYDKDGYFAEPGDGENGGEIDLIAEVYVGRAPVDSIEEVQNFVRKTIWYENFTMNQPSDYKQVDSYLKKALLGGEYLGFGEPAEYGKNSKEEIRVGSSEHNYTTKGFPSGYYVDTLYDADYPECRYGGPRDSYCWQYTELIDKMNNNVHAINHLGHASSNMVMKLCHNLYSDCTYCSSWEEYNKTNLDMLTNEKYFLAYSQGCYPGSFDNWNYAGCFSKTDSLAENFVVKEHGAFATIMNSRYGFGRRDSTDGPSQRFDRQFWDAIFSEGKTNLGLANQDSKEDNIGGIMGGYYNEDSSRVLRWMYYGLNLLGDPETSFYVIPRLEHNLQLKSVLVNESRILEPKENYEFPVIIENNGKNDESDVQVRFKINDLEEEIKTIDYLEKNNSVTINFSWYSDIGGIINISFEIINEDDFFEDNELSKFLVVSPIKFTGENFNDYGYDSDNDGRYDYVAVEVEVDSIYEGGQTFSGYLIYNQSVPIDYISAHANLIYGKNKITFYFNRYNIINHNLTGKFLLSSVSYYKYYYGAGYVYDILLNAYNTSEYNHEDFDDLPAKFTNQFLDYAYDINKDGKDDYLIFTAKVNISEPGIYRIYGYVAQNQTIFGKSYHSRIFNFTKTGIYNINYPVLGSDINIKNISGNFDLRNLRIYKYGYGYSNKLVHFTEDYNGGQYDYDEFEKVVELNGNFSDRAVDFNNDGKYDYLIVEAGVEVNRAGKYGLGSQLAREDNWVGYGKNYQFLEPGDNQTIEIYFLGSQIRNADNPGTTYFTIPYFYSYGRIGDARSFSYNTSVYNMLDFDSNTTGFKEFPNLRLISVEINGKHSDAIVDENDNLEVRSVIYNYGEKDSGAFNVSFFYDGKLKEKQEIENIGGIEQINNSGYISNKPRNYTFSTNLIAEKGVHLLEVVIDYEDVVDENEYYSASNHDDYLLIVGEPPFEDKCYDSDFGKNYYVKGICQDAEGNSEDYCEGDYLWEYVCSADYCSFADSGGYLCENGCSNGACINKTNIIQNINLQQGWNLVSVYLDLENKNADDVFPDALVVYEWDGSKYVIPETIEPKKAYWIALASEKSYSLTGELVSNNQISLTEGWNLVGFIDDRDLLTEQEILAIYEWDGEKYIGPSQIEKGKGYWIASSGEIII